MSTESGLPSQRVLRRAIADIGKASNAAAVLVVAVQPPSNVVRISPDDGVAELPSRTMIEIVPGLEAVLARPLASHLRAIADRLDGWADAEGEPGPGFGPAFVTKERFS